MPAAWAPARESEMTTTWTGADRGAPRPNLRGSTRKVPKAKRNLVTIKRTVKQCMERLLELKHSATAVAFNPMVVGGQFIQPTYLSQGTAATNRIGQQIKLHSLALHALIQSPAAMASDVIRLVGIVDRFPAGALPAATDILTAATLPASYNMDKVDHLGHRFRFKVLFDRTYEVYNSAAATTTRQVPVFLNVKLNHLVNYQGNAGNVTDLLHNNVLIYVATNSGNCSLNGEAMICYTDE